MPAANSQEQRPNQMTLGAKKDELVLLDLSGTEYVNELSQFLVRGLSQAPVKMDSLLGTEAAVCIEVAPGKTRTFHQIIASARYGGNEQGGHAYEFELRPWLWLLGHRVNSRIFHEMTVQDVIQQVCTDSLGALARLRFDTSLGTTVREYTVQYNESDMAFIRRLLEEEGINFHFDMQAGQHELVLTDSAGSFPMAAVSSVEYNPTDRGGIKGAHTFSMVADQRQVTPGAFRTSDYDFKAPNSGMEKTAEHSRPYEHSTFEVYRYPGNYTEGGPGQSIANRRRDALRTKDAVVMAQGFAPSLTAGSRFSLSKAADSELNGSYAVLQARHEFSANTYRSGAGGGRRSAPYQGSYILTKEANPIAPDLITPKPRVFGPQTAVVVDGADSSSDEYSRIKVKFFWDQNDQSMFCRVAQMWAGKNWGTVFVPRVDMEVVVDFLHGDIDQPIVTGCVYNAQNPAPWDLASDRTISGIKTETMGGGGYNELSFDDKGGSEKVHIHAQKDYVADIENDSTKTIGGNYKTDITGTRTITVQGASSLKSLASVKIEATSSIELVCGTSKITMDPSGIKISALNIEVSATAQLKTTGLQAQHGASVDLSIQSAIVRINS
jgi:type VI secretion system secreted protein VgrG